MNDTIIFDSSIMNIDADTIDEPFEYMDQLLKQITTIDIQDFDFELFEKYVEELDSTEFNEFWNSKMLPVIREIDSKYMVVDIDEFENSDTNAKQIMTSKYIEFLMSVLPYKIIFAKYIRKPFNSISELATWLDTRDVSKDLTNLLNEDIIVIKNMYSLIKNTIYDAKKSNAEYKQRINKLSSYIEYEKNFKEYFIGIVQDTEQENLKNLILEYYSNEYL